MMKKKLLYAACYCLPMFVPIGSCETPDPSDESWVNPIQIEVSGMEIIENDRYYGLTGYAPAEGITFTATVTSEGKTLDSLFAADIANYNTYANERAPFSDFSYNGVDLTFLTKEKPYQIEVTISPNDTEEERTAQLRFGDSYDSFCQLVIIQRAR